MTKLIRKCTDRRRERGAALAEFAIAVPVFVMLFIGVIDFARAMWTHNTLEHAAREVVRYASVHSTDSGDPIGISETTAYAHNRTVGLSPERLTVQANYEPSNTMGGIVQINLIYDFTPVVPVMPDSVKTLVGTSQMRITY